MDRRIHDELDEVKLEVEKLREECRAKTDICHSLKKFQAEQLAKSRHDTLEIDKLARNLASKSEEICEIRQMCEELQSILQRKDSFLQQISSRNEKLRAECGEKMSKLEIENRNLVLSLDEASSRIQDLDEKTNLSSEEIAGLKRLLLKKPEKGFEESKDLKQREEYILKLDEENRVSQEQLKWKNEQFSHLEDEHEQVRTQFQASQMEWVKEKSALVDKITYLQADLEAQVQVSKNLETQLRVSNQTLAGEESRRRVLETELSEFRSRFGNVSLDCQAEESEVERLIMKRDEEIGKLRMLLSKREVLDNERKFKIEQLESENSELLLSLKDIREAQISSDARLAPSKELRHKHEDLEKLHSKCGLKTKEEEEIASSLKQKNNAMEVQLEKYKTMLHASKRELEILKLKLVENQGALEKGKTTLLAVVKDKNGEIGKLQENVFQLESAILAKSEAEEMLNQEKDYYIRLAEDRNCSIKSLQSEVDQLKKELVNALEQENKKFSSYIEEKDQKIQELREQLECQGKLVIQAKQDVLQLEASLQTTMSEVQELKSQLAEHESRKQTFLEDLRMATMEKESLLAHLESIYGKIEIFCQEDVELAAMLGNLLHISEEDCEQGDAVDDIIAIPVPRKPVQPNLDERTPLSELNC